MKQILLAISSLVLLNQSYSQILDNAMFRIYRASFIDGALTHLRIDRDNTYEMKIMEFHCSLCDFEELSEFINSKGIWVQSNDTIYLKSEYRKTISLCIINDSLLKPTFPINYKYYDTIHDSIKNKMMNSMKQTDIEDFYLIYDTYPNGVAKLIVDKYRMRRNEYVIEITPNGMIKRVDYYWDDKKRKKIR